MVARKIHDLKVAGSSPVLATTTKKGCSEIGEGGHCYRGSRLDPVIAWGGRIEDFSSRNTRRERRKKGAKQLAPFAIW